MEGIDPDDEIDPNDEIDQYVKILTCHDKNLGLEFDYFKKHRETQINLFFLRGLANEFRSRRGEPEL